MTLTVQTSDGLDDADSYNSLADLVAIAEKFAAADFLALEDAEQERCAREATEYLDTIARYKGTRLNADQSTEFPREGLVDWSGFTISGVPAKVKRAHAELAFVAATESLYVDLDRGGKIAGESVGGISVSYAPDAPVGRVFRKAMKLLEQYVRPDGELYAPYETTDIADGAFSVGMHDGPSED